MTTTQMRTVTVIYYDENSLELMHSTQNFPQNKYGRVIIPAEFKQNKSIIAVCDGEVLMLNKLGDRIIAADPKVAS